MSETTEWIPNKRNGLKPLPTPIRGGIELHPVEVKVKGEEEVSLAHWNPREKKWECESGVNEVYGVTHWRELATARPGS